VARKTLEEEKGQYEHQPKAQQEKAGQTKPPDRFHLPGVEPHHAEQPNKDTAMAKTWTTAHWVVGTDERTLGGWSSPRTTKQALPPELLTLPNG
jgi:hypothetical protein